MPGLKRSRNAKYPARKKRGEIMHRTLPRTYILSKQMSTSRMFPAKKTLRTTLRYFGNFISVNPGIGGAAASHVFSCNGLYDPDITSTGHQPIGFDQFMAMYDHYTVVGAKMKAFFKNGDSTNSGYAFVAVRDSATTTTNTLELVENGYIAVAQLDRAGNNKSCVTLVQSVDVASYLGRKDALSDSQLKGTSGANPTEQAMFWVGAFSDTNVDMGSVSINVIIEYDVIFHERYTLAPS